jgi:hypothetical protein
VNNFKEASVHQLEDILRLVDTKALMWGHMQMVDDWTTDGTYVHETFDANDIIAMLSTVEDL